MGYDIYDMNGYVGRLGSATATCLLNEYLEKKGGREFHKFVNTGKVKKTPKLMKEIVNLPISEDSDTRVITITDGFDDDNVGEGPQILYIP